MKNFIWIMVAVVCLSLVGAPKVMAQEEDAAASVMVTSPAESGESFMWKTLTADQKLKLITDAITTLRAKRGATIRKEPGFYTAQINEIYQDNPNLDAVFVGSILRALAITYRDFDNGQDPEELIRVELGEDAYQKSLKNKAAVEEIYKEYLRTKE